MVRREILEVVCCGRCRGDFLAHKNWVVCRHCRTSYPVLGGLPFVFERLAQDESRVAERMAPDEASKRR